MSVENPIFATHKWIYKVNMERSTHPTYQSYIYQSEEI